MKRRDSALDLLRILSSVCVVLLHITGEYLGAATSTAWFGTLYREHMLFSALAHGLTRFSVPCFIMLTGALALSNAENRDYRRYYQKTFRRLLPPLILFSALYFLAYLAVFARNAKSSGDISLLLIPIQRLLSGAPGYHLWYLYMMLGVHLLIPWAIRFRETIGEAQNEKVTVLFFLLSAVSMLLSKCEIYWSPGLSFGYLSYAMMGDLLYRKIGRKKSNAHALLHILAGILTGMLLGYLRFRQAKIGMDDEALPCPLLQPCSPIPIVMSIFIFSGFCRLHLPQGWDTVLHKINRLCLPIYLVHPAILFVAQRFVAPSHDCRTMTLLLWLAICALSTIFALLWNSAIGRYRRKRPQGTSQPADAAGIPQETFR